MHDQSIISFSQNNSIGCIVIRKEDKLIYNTNDITSYVMENDINDVYNN